MCVPSMYYAGAGAGEGKSIVKTNPGTTGSVEITSWRHCMLSVNIQYCYHPFALSTNHKIYYFQCNLEFVHLK